MGDEYNTIDCKSEGFFSDKGSRFLSFAFRVNSEEEVREHLQRLKKEHHSARHHCYAYRLGPLGDKFRLNDDGEPSGTAGKPIFRQLCSVGVTNVLLVVVRYFGGTLLGVSGLISAYKKAAYSALQNATIISQIIEQKLKLNFDYSHQILVNRIMKEFAIELISAKYGERCAYNLAVRLNKVDKVIAQLKTLPGVEIVTSRAKKN